MRRKRKQLLDSCKMDDNRKKINSDEDESNDQLAAKSVVLYHVIMQISKALKLCHSDKKFFGSEIHVETERLLLFTCK